VLTLSHRSAAAAEAAASLALSMLGKEKEADV